MLHRFLVRLALAVLMGVVALPAPAGALPRNTRVEVYAQGLRAPVDAIHLPDTPKILVTERLTGEIREIRVGVLRGKPCFDLDVATEGERGLLGITIDPNFASNHFVYVFYTANTTPRENRVDRFTYIDGACTNRTPIVSQLPSANPHNAGQIEILDGKLFISVGDAGLPRNAQDLSINAGKILRYNLDGSIPADNPFNQPGAPSPVWSYGHRNGFGLAVRRDTSQVYEAENGPECDDELNLIAPGNNYAWGPEYGCSGPDYNPIGDGPVEPLYRFAGGTSTVAPTDAWWYQGRMSALNNQLYVTSFVDGRVHRFKMSADGTTVNGHFIVYDDPGRLIDVFKGPGGWLYFISLDSTFTGTVKRIVPN